ncbi:hypothetical protein TRFO_31137 [Tritrichomonas foetus]|uniref:Uncharacterized protein n=1 Tax=Tritrichomonas foetus TaxID=1144522 RepID=A0A1J4JS28_9EUKA|nr:hypothetical protein TRFO_31137 [Tritrichomonas foetus]|eukprot:OHT01943.1 hypothetical protein TRFO_31137 [Tritrichomonas foetus]
MQIQKILPKNSEIRSIRSYLNFVMNPVIHQQLVEAMQYFPSQISANSQYQFSVKFNRANSPQNTFEVILNADYPQSAPRIRRGNKEFQTLMTSSWMPVFTLRHLVEHLQVCSDVVLAGQFSLNKNEVKNIVYSSRPEAVATKEARDNLLKSNLMPTTQKAFEQAQHVKKLMAEEQSKVNNGIVDVSTKAEKLRSVKPDLVATSSPATVSGENQSQKASAIKKYKHEAKKVKKEVNNVLAEISNGDITFSECKEKLTKLYEKMYLMEESAQMLEDRNDI